LEKKKKKGKGEAPRPWKENIHETCRGEKRRKKKKKKRDDFSPIKEERERGEGKSCSWDQGKLQVSFAEKEERGKEIAFFPLVEKKEEEKRSAPSVVAEEGEKGGHGAGGEKKKKKKNAFLL